MQTLAMLLHAARWRPYWRGLLAALLVVVTWLALTPKPPSIGFDAYDKLNHLMAFAALAATAWPAAAPARGHALRCAGGLLLYGGAIELAQSMVPPRSGEWLDLVADAVGIALGLALAASAQRALRRGRR